MIIQSAMSRLFVLGAAVFLLAGCSGSGASTAAPAALESSSFSALLPDGSPMSLNVESGQPSFFDADFWVLSQAGADAFEGGSCYGDVSGQTVQAACVDETGANFQLTGQAVQGGYDLTRSDIPGSTLQFRSSDVIQATTLTTIQFPYQIDIAGSYRATVKGVINDGNVASELKGTFALMPTTVVFYGQSFTTITVDISEFAHLYAEFPGIGPKTLGKVKMAATRAMLYVNSKPGMPPGPDSEVIVDMSPPILWQ